MKLSVSRETFLAQARHRRPRCLDPQRDPDPRRRPHPRRGHPRWSSRPPTWSSASACRVEAIADARRHRRRPRPAAARRGPLAAEGRALARVPLVASRTSRSSPARRAFHLRTLPAEDFPKLPEAPRRPALADACPPAPSWRRSAAWPGRPRVTRRGRTSPACWCRPSERELRMVATDSYRLSVKETTLERGAQRLARGQRAGADAAGARPDRRRRRGATRSASPRSENQVVFAVGDVVLSLAARRGPLPQLPAAAARVLRARAAGRAARSCSRSCGGSACWRRRTRRCGCASRRARSEVSAQTPDVGEASESLPVPFKGEPLEIGFNPEFFRDGLESAESDELVLKLISPLRPGPDPVGRRGRLPLPRHADPPQRLSVLVQRAYVAPRLPQLRARRASSWATASPWSAGPTGPARRTCWRRSTSRCTGRSPRTSNERELVRRGASVTRVRLDIEGERGRAPRSRWASTPGEPKRVRVDGARGGRRWPRVRRRARSWRLPARPPRAGEGRPGRPPRAPGPARRRAVAGARGHALGLLARARPAQRPARRASARGAPAPDALDAWDAELARHGVRADGRPPRGRSTRSRPPSPARPAELGLPEPASSRYRPRSRATDAEGLARGARASAAPPTSSAASPRTGRTATTSRSPRRPCRCAPTARRASSARRCWRCCSPSATLLAERRGRPPLMLLDDVMSELDADPPRAPGRAACAPAARRVLTTTDAEHVPGAHDQRAARWSRWPPASRRGGRVGGVRRLAPRPLARGARRGRRGGRAGDPARPRAGGLARGGRGGAWPRRPSRSREREGVVTVRCGRRVWAQELELLDADLGRA